MIKKENKFFNKAMKNQENKISGATKKIVISGLRSHECKKTTYLSRLLFLWENGIRSKLPGPIGLDLSYENFIFLFTT